MNFFNIGRPAKNSLLSRIFFPKSSGLEQHVLENVPSKALKRPVKVRLLLPEGYWASSAAYPSLYLNDGQDLEALQLEQALARLFRQRRVAPFVLIAIHANEQRMQEYGTAGQPDYKKRGSKAAAYTEFVQQELLPLLHARYRLLDDSRQRAVAGFSLGGLSAFDMAWKQPELFSRVGVFSGSLWWRDQAFDPGQPDANRIAHRMVEQGPAREGLQFWLQAGTDDEKADRNNNGIIDAIDDTLDLIKALEQQGYRQGRDIRYLEVRGGQHNPKTWGKAMPDFLQWAFPSADGGATKK